jgi:NAD(P)-dependent dehydrogenase (short-subunit alcohol dehydrogenase family)
MMAAASGWVAASVPAIMSRVTATPTRSPSVGGRGWHGCRVNTISPGIIFTPLAKDQLTGPRREGYRRMIELCPVGRGGTPDEVRTVGALLMGPEGGFITGSDFLMDGGVTAAYRFGDLAPK